MEKLSRYGGFMLQVIVDALTCVSVQSFVRSRWHKGLFTMKIFYANILILVSIIAIS